MKISAIQAVLLLFGFVVVVLTVAYLSNPHFPVLVIAGENSPGTWLSGVLLIFMAALSLVISMRKERFPWFLATVFFLFLALDEHFMFHEQLQEHIMFSRYMRKSLAWIYSIPVLAGAVAGCVLAFMLWHQLPSNSRTLLFIATGFGSASVCIDMMAGGVVWEEGFKLMAELLMVCALLIKLEK